jgi:hypothetical protein
MASVLTKFLIGIGWQTDDFKKGERDINTGLENVKTNILTTGTAISGAMIGLGKSVINTADKINTMALSTNTLYTSARDVNNFGLALRGVGGDAGDAVGEIEHAESALADLRLKGEAGVFGGELQMAGINIEPLLKVESGAQFMAELSKQMPTLTKEQKLSVQQTLGLSPATIELLSKGEAEYSKIMNHVDNVAGLTPELINTSKELNAALAETQLRWDGIYNTMAGSIMPILTDMTKKTSEWITDTIAPIVEEHPVEMAVGGSLVAAGAASGAAGAGLSMLGMGAAGAAAGAAAIPTAVIGAGIIASPYIDEALQGNKIYDIVNSATVTALHGITGIDISRGNVHKDEPTLWENFINTDVSENDKQVKKYSNEFLTNVQGNAFAPLKVAEPENDKQSSWKDAFIESEQSVMYAPEQYAPPEFKMPPPQQMDVQLKSSNLPPIKNNINLTVQLDGRAFESKVQEITERQAISTEDDLKSTTAR